MRWLVVDKLRRLVFDEVGSQMVAPDDSLLCEVEVILPGSGTGGGLLLVIDVVGVAVMVVTVMGCIRPRSATGDVDTALVEFND